MRRHIIIALLALMPFVAWAQEPALKTTADSINYFIGMINGMQFRLMLQSQKENMPGVPANFELTKSGMIAGINGESTYSMEELSEYLNGQLVLMQAQTKAKAEKTEQDFLAQNAKRKGVKTTPSGLQYEVLTKAKDKKAPHPAATDTVRVHYEGKLLDGTVFDSSYERGEPIEFPLSGVIKGWTEGVQLMAVGSKYRFYIPYSLAYGERGAGEDIPPYSTLIFTIELLEIK